MIDIKLIRENPELVKENIKKKFQDHKLVLVDEVIELDKKNREAKLNGDNLRSERKRLSDEIGKLMKAGQKEEAGKIRQEVQSVNSELKTEDPKAEETKKDDSYGKKENAEFKIELIKEKGCPSMEKILTRMLEKIEEVSAA